MHEDTKTPLARAIAVAGSQSELARRIGVTQAHIWQWLHRGKRRIPAEYVLKVEKATGIPRHELRPDLYPVEE
jgi:DNA-binding transcriptional regulator YdaS (Cro superfamily)